MKAAFYTKPGAASDVLVVGEQPMPVPQQGEVRIHVRTSGVNPSDVKSRAGLLGGSQAFPLIIPHSDGAGEIDAVGFGVHDRRVGERVWLWNAQWRRPFGTAAEYVVVPAEQAVPLPAEIDDAVGACLGIPALTAYQAVRLAGAGPERTILVVGGAGSVGHYAIQIARIQGARVLTTISSEAKAAHAKQAGADEVINYRTQDVGAKVKELTGGRGVDAIIELDLAVNAPLIPAILKPHGIVVVYGISRADLSVPARWLLQNTGTLRFFLVYDMSEEDRAATLGGLTALLRENRLVHTIAARFPLGDIVAAHRAVEAGAAMGNVVVDVS